MKIKELQNFSEEAFSRISELMSQLSPELNITVESLKAMLADPNSHLYVAEDNGRIVGCACLCIFHQPFRMEGNVESVVVSSECRGRHLGRLLVEHIIAEAERNGVRQLHLTSNPKRLAANELYRSLGFLQRETNVYVMDIAG